MGELSDFYRAARAKFDSDPGFADRARQRVVLLQAGDARTLELWRQLVDLSKRYFSTVYQRLGDRPARRARARRERLQRGAARGRGRAREQRAREHQRRRAVRVPAGVHESRRRAVAAHRAQAGRRLRLRRHGSRGAALPHADARRHAAALRRRRAAGAAPRHGVRRRRPGRLAEGRPRARSTWRSAPCSAPTRRCSSRAPAIRCGSRICSTRPSSAPPRSSQRRSPDGDAGARARAGAADRHRRREVRGSLERPHQRLRVRLGPHARGRRAHGPVLAVRATRASTRSSAAPRSRASRARRTLRSA